MADAVEKFNNGVSADNVGMLEASVDGFAITPNDAADVTYITRAIYVGSDGNMKVDLKSGVTLTFSNLAAGSILPIRATRIYDTDTTCTNLIALL